MPTTVKDATSTRTEKRTVRPRGFSINGNGHRSNGFRGGGGGGDNSGRDDAAHDRRPIRYKLGLVIGLVAITMTFGALAGAFVLRLATNHDWQPIKMPSILWASTALIVVSSLTLEAARRALRQRSARSYSRWLWTTLGFGIGFLVAQLLAWRELVARGVYLATNPLSSFFYVITGAHGLHLVGGIAALGYLIARAETLDAQTLTRQQAASEATAIYWHFMDALWIGLFALLSLW
ncbi:MAG: hypothetical protein C4334_00345 [Pyrinomonas sp.]|uniref:cytochrome c oxidase subunit 3 n=1 Tax=Pyrinomonas sp. TaxID=2080306 RepID=UPI003333BD3F